MLLFASCLVLLILVILFLYFSKDFNYWKKRNVPYFEPSPIVGNISSIVKKEQSIGDFLASSYKMGNEPYVGLYILNKPYLLLRDPDIIKNILISDFDYFADRTAVDNEYDRFGRYLLLLMTADKWKPLRTLVTPVFSTGKNKSMISPINEVCDRLNAYINDSALNKLSSNCRNLTIRFAIDVVANCYFGLNTHCFENEDPSFLHMSKRFFDTRFKRSIQVASYFVAPFLVKTFRMKFLDPVSANFMRDVCFQVLEERKRANAPRGDLIDILLKSHEEQPENVIEQDKLAAMFMQFITAGYETIGGALAYGIFELSRHQEVQKKLRNEIQDTLKKHGTITYEVLQEMKYLEMVVKETSRKYPLLPFLDRRCLKTYKVPGHDLVIEKGTGIYVSLLGLHNDPQYFPNPETFDPERFARTLDIPSCAFLPFGGGLRKCIGSRFADLASKIALIKLISNFQIDKSKDCIENITFSPNWVFLVPENNLNVCIKPLRQDT